MVGLATQLRLPASDVEAGLAALEGEGVALTGHFERGDAATDEILQERLHDLGVFSSSLPEAEDVLATLGIDSQSHYKQGFVKHQAVDQDGHDVEVLQ